MSRKLDATGDQRVWREMEARMSVIRSAILKVEATITKYEDHLEECHLRADEAQYGDQGQSDSHQSNDDIKMEPSTEEEEDPLSQPSSLTTQPQEEADVKGTQEEADTEGAQSVTSGGSITVMPEEEEILMGDWTPTKGRSPASDISSMMGDMARLQVHTPPHEKTEGGETSK